MFEVFSAIYKRSATILVTMTGQDSCPSVYLPFCKCTVHSSTLAEDWPLSELSRLKEACLSFDMTK